MTRTIPLLASLLLAACADPAAPPAPSRAASEQPDATPPSQPAETLPEVEGAPAPAVVEAPEERVRPVLVWGRDDEGLSYTWWVEREREGGWDVVGTTGVVVAIDGALHHWVVDEEPVATELDCELFETVPGTGEGTGARAFLERVDGGDRREVLAPAAAEARESAEWTESVRLLGSLGPYLFVERETYSYHCGAHGGTEHETFVWDARTGEPVELYDAGARAALERVMEPAAKQALADESDGESLLFGDEVHRTRVRPVFEPNGIVRMEHQWTGATCYACSDGEWGSYTVSTQLLTDELPPAVAPHAADIGDALRFLHGEVEGLVVGGVSKADPDARDAFEALPVEGC